MYFDQAVVGVVDVATSIGWGAGVGLTEGVAVGIVAVANSPRLSKLVVGVVAVVARPLC